MQVPARFEVQNGRCRPRGARGAPAAFRPQGGEPEARTQGRLRLPRAAGTPWADSAHAWSVPRINPCAYYIVPDIRPDGQKAEIWR